MLGTKGFRGLLYFRERNKEHWKTVHFVAVSNLDPAKPVGQAQDQPKKHVLKSEDTFDLLWVDALADSIIVVDKDGNEYGWDPNTKLPPDLRMKEPTWGTSTAHYDKKSKGKGLARGKVRRKVPACTLRHFDK